MPTRADFCIVSATGNWKVGLEVLPLKLGHRIQAACGREKFLILTSMFCVLFGLASIANTQLAADGVWFWYATFWLAGKHIYADMHLALQPLYVLETASCLALLGKGWLVGKVPAALHLVAICSGMFLVLRDSTLRDYQKAIVLTCAFFVSINIPAYRFDDYRALSDALEVYSLVFLLMLARTSQAWRSIALSTALGILCGLATMNRLNDGGALAATVAIAIVCMAPSRRFLSLVAFVVVSALTVLLVVRITGDTLHDYATYSIFGAAGIKGGAGNVMLYPLRLPWSVLQFLSDRHVAAMLAYVLGSAAIWAGLILPYLRPKRSRELWMPAAGLICILLPLHHFLIRGLSRDGLLLRNLAALGVLLVIALGLAVTVRLLTLRYAPHAMRAANRREILLLVPLGQLASSSMSTGGSHLGLYGPIAIMVLLLPIASPIQVKSQWASSFLLAVTAILAFHCQHLKYERPCIWQGYHSAPLFGRRQWYRHPVYGPMVIESGLLQFIEPICAATAKDGTGSELLSLPFSYPNYFCHIPPWHGYVQTFFDTSSEQTIDGLMDELDKAPPKWIVYQRQLKNLQLHEQRYNQGKPLPHRYLDQLIERKIEAGQWRPVYTSTYGTDSSFDNDWILLQTRP